MFNIVRFKSRPAKTAAQFGGFFSSFSLAAASALLLSACSSGDDKVSYESGGMTHTFVGGKNLEKQPFLLPIYPNATASGEVRADGSDEENSFMILSTSDPIGQVSEYYMTELKKQGWEVSRQQVMPKLFNLNASKDKLEGSIMLSTDEHNKTIINLSVAVEPQGVPKVSGEQFNPDKINPPTD